MKKHFLLLVMALMSITAWAETIALTPYVITKTYGTADAAYVVSSSNFLIAENPGALTKAQIAAAINTAGGIQRVNSVAGTMAGEAVGTYSYTFPTAITIGDQDYDVVTTQNGTLNITKKVINTGINFTKDYDGAAMGTVTIAAANAASTNFTKAAWEEWSDVGLTLTATGEDAAAVNYKAGGYDNTVEATITSSNYEVGDTKGTLTINQINLGTNAGISITVDPTEANAGALTAVPAVTVSFGGTPLTVGGENDYTYAWKKGEDAIADPTVASFATAGTYTVTVTGAGNFTSTKSATFKINGTSLEGAVVTLAETEYIYDGAAKTPGVTAITLGGNALTVADFDVAYGEDNINAGTVTVTVTGKDNTTYFNQQATATFEIKPIDLSLAASAVTIDAIAAQTYNTKEQKPVPVVKVNGVVLAATVGEGDAQKTNWTATYANNTNATAAATVTVTGQGNYTGEKTATFEISPKSLATLANTEFAAYDDAEYTGAQITPATTGKVKFTYASAMAAGETDQFVTLVEGTDYDVTYGENIAYAAAEAGSVTYTGKGNYSGTKKVYFNITKKPLVITAKSYTINYGATRPAYEVEYTGLVESDLENGAPKAGVFTTPVTVKQCTYGTTTEENTTNAGTYSLVPYGAAANNYSLTAEGSYVNGTLVINANLVTLKVVNKKVPFGTAEPEYSATGTIESTAASFNDFYALEIVGDASASLADLTTGQVFTYTRANADTKTVGTYAVSVSGPATLAGGYQVTYQAGTLEIEKLKLVAVAQDKAISWHGGEPAMAEGYDLLNNAANIKFQTYVDNDNTKDLTDVTLLAANYAGVSNPQAVADVVSKIEWVNEAGNAYTSGWEKGHPGSIHVTLLTDLSAYTANYDITTKDGAVTFNDVDVAALALDGSAAGQFAAIQDADNLTYTAVTFKPAKRNGTVALQAEKWNVYVLPFATSVRELSTLAGIDYAVVNIINEESTNGIQFKLHMGAIPANTPFAMKTLTALDGATLTFANKKIVNGADADGYVVCPVGQTGVKFVGCYAEKQLTTADGESKRFLVNDGWHYCSSNPYTVKPFEAYMDYTESVLAPGLGVITFEEMDGSTTAISPVVFNGNSAKLAAEGWYTVGGMKMQGAPTQKGVYIKDGKKVVIK